MSKKKKTLDELLEEALVSENEQLYEIPENWEWVKIGRITNVVSGGTPKTQIKEYYESGEIAWISPADLSGYEEKYISYGKKNITQLGLAKSSAKLMPKKTVLLSTRAPIGYVVIANNELSTNQGFKSFLPNESYLPEYLYWYLKNSKGYLESMASGTTFKELSGSKAKEISFPLAPVKEQERITRKIEILFAKIDEAQQLIEEAKETFKLRRAAILDEAFNGELTLNTENEVWNTSKLGDLIIEGPQNGLYKPQNAYGEGNLIVRIDNFYDGYINSWDSLKRLSLNPTELQTYGIADGDILINRVNSIQYLGKSALVRNLKEPCVFESNVMRLRVNKELIDNEYLILYLNSNGGLQELRKNAKHAVNQASINQTDVKNVLIPLPSIKEQKEIVEIVEQLLEKESTVLNLINEEYSRLNFLKHSILSKAFKGELGTNDPTDEPAIELLISIL